MAPYGQSSYSALNGLRSQNPPAHSSPYQSTANGASSRLRPNSGLVLPSISFKHSPFYELKYQVGDAKTLEGASAAVPPSLRAANAPRAN